MNTLWRPFFLRNHTSHKTTVWAGRPFPPAGHARSRRVRRRAASPGEEATAQAAAGIPHTAPSARPSTRAGPRVIRNGAETPEDKVQQRGRGVSQGGARRGPFFSGGGCRRTWAGGAPAAADEASGRGGVRAAAAAARRRGPGARPCGLRRARYTAPLCLTRLLRRCFHPCVECPRSHTAPALRALRPLARHLRALCSRR